MQTIILRKGKLSVIKRIIKVTTTVCFRNPQTFGEVCQKKLHLQPYSFPTTNSSSDDKSMFFLETSGRSWLTPREACALESAVTSSHLSVNIIFLTEFVDLYDNSTCAIFKLLPSVSFFTIKLCDAFVNTPLHRFYQREEFRKSLFKSVHTSDALRIALIYKVGGFYSDLDTLTLGDLSGLENVIGATSMRGAEPHLANGAFHLRRHHPLLWRTMEDIVTRYRGAHRNEIGPLLVTRAVRRHYNISDVSSVNIKGEGGLQVLPSRAFYPAKSEVTQYYC